MDDHLLADFARRQGGVVSSTQIRVCGLSRSGARHRVATGRLFPVRRRAYTLSPHWDAATLRWAAVLATDQQHAVLSHWTAAEIHRMSKWRAPAIHLSVPGAGGRAASGLVIHRPRRFGPGDVVQVDGLRVTSPARTVLDIAATADDRVIHGLIREGEYLGLLPAGAMPQVVAAHPSHPGAPRVRRADPATPVAALGQTPLEDELEALIRTLPLPAPDPQVALSGISGARYRVDFGWSAFRLAAEADSRSAHERASSLVTDRFRDNDLAAVGWLVLRFTAEQMRDGRAGAGRQLVAAAANRGWLQGG